MSWLIVGMLALRTSIGLAPGNIIERAEDFPTRKTKSRHPRKLRKGAHPSQKTATQDCIAAGI
jgi:hypothetical protein